MTNISQLKVPTDLPQSTARVLVVDDDTYVRRLQSASLSHLYEVLEATNGLDALCVVKKFHPCAVLLM